MNFEIEPIADIATGAVIASAVEPGEGDARGLASTPCLNCKAQLDGPFCRNCGQKAKVHRTLNAFWHDLIHGVFHFDGKIWRTLPMLMWHPGVLTRRYVHGERAKFVSPLALFLFCVFVTYASVNSLVPTSLDGAIESPASIEKDFIDGKREAEAEIKELQADLREAKAEGADVAAIELAISKQADAIAKLDSEYKAKIRKRQLAQSLTVDERKKTEAKIAEITGEIAAAKKAGQSTTNLDAALSDKQTELKVLKNITALANKGGTISAEDINVNMFGIESLNQAAKHALENPQLVMYKVQSSAYKYAWLLIILSTPFVWLIFAWRRQYLVFDHAVFVTYSLCFMLLLTTFGSFALRFESWAPFTATFLTFAPVLHMYRQLKESYVLSRFSTLWRTALLSMIAMTVLALFVVIIITLGLTG
jgi:Protein of unknown function (DUF3667)